MIDHSQPRRKALASPAWLGSDLPSTNFLPTLPINLPIFPCLPITPQCLPIHPPPPTSLPMRPPFTKMQLQTPQLSAESPHATSPMSDNTTRTFPTLVMPPSKGENPPTSEKYQVDKYQTVPS